jgi:hypothetical protein
MRWRLRLVTSAVLGVVLAASAAGATGVDARAVLEKAGAPPVAGQSFRVYAGVHGLPPNAGPEFDFTVTVDVGSGLQIVKVSQTYNAARCTTVGSKITCFGTAIGAREYADTYNLDLRAAKAGSYLVSSAVTVEGQTDTNPANNEAELTVAVGEAAVSASAFRLSPARAGRALQATLLLTRAGAPVQPDRVACAATAAGKRLGGKAVRLANGGRCLWTLAASARGKRISGSISATAGGKSFTRRFAVLAR